MKIALVGYGKMGKTIERIALSKGHSISFVIDKDNTNDLVKINPENTDVAIEFTNPEVAYTNITTLLKNGVAVVSGSTGWLDKKTEVENLTNSTGAAFFYASNFSLGVNIFFHLNKVLAKIMNNFSSEYNLWTEEIHHTEKKDAPSGTAITLAEGIMENFTQKNKWVNEMSNQTAELSIVSKREGLVPGTHIINYDSAIDSIQISHTAHSREGFASGAVIAAEWLKGKKGNYSMDDMLKF
ncbi:MAG: 4-hydroxy-tetrahydrodipicolinate reductase [Cytophagales bacterium]